MWTVKSPGNHPHTSQAGMKTLWQAKLPGRATWKEHSPFYWAACRLCRALQVSSFCGWSPMLGLALVMQLSESLLSLWVSLTYIPLGNPNKTQWFTKSDTDVFCTLVWLTSPSWVRRSVCVCLPKKSLPHNFFGLLRVFLVVYFYIPFSKDNFQNTNECCCF